MDFWRRYVDDTLSFVKNDQVENVLKMLNSFHSSINFTYEIENNSKISFLDVKIHRQHNGNFLTSVFRKPTNTDLYMHWKSFAPRAWKIGTLRTLIQRGYIICSNEKFRKEEFNHLRHVFTNINGYPGYVVKRVMHEEKLKVDNATPIEQASIEQDVVCPTMVLPFKGQTGVNIISNLTNTITRLLPSNVKPRIVYTSKKLSSCFSLKDKTEKQHKHDVVYKFKCSEVGCASTYIGETSRRLSERVMEHQRRDKKSHILQHSQSTGHPQAVLNDFEILKENCGGYKRRKLSESLFIRDEKPVLNSQDQSIPLTLFN